MGIMDTGKMIMKARKAQAQMKKTTAAGQSKSGKTAVLINGLNEIEEISFDFWERDDEGNIIEDTMTVDDGFFDDLEKEVIQAFAAAKKELESKLQETMDLDSIRDMLGS